MMFAKFERAILQERVPAGPARARAQGFGRPRIDAGMERRDALARGDRGILKIAADLGVGSGTVQRVKAAAQHR